MVVRKTLVWAPVERELCPHQQGGGQQPPHWVLGRLGLRNTQRTVVLGRGIVVLVDLMYSVDTEGKMFHEGNTEAKCQTGVFILLTSNWVKP